MLDLIRRYPLGFTLAVLLHLLIVLLMVFGLDWLNPPEPRKPVQVVQARLVDASRAEQAARKKQLEEKKRREAEARRKKQEREKRRLAEEKRKKKQEAERKRKLEQERRKKREAERKRKEEARKKAEAERKRQLALQKKREEEKRRRAELERKRRLEEKKRREAEARRKAEEARRKAEEERRRREAARKAREAELAAQLQAEREARERASVTAAIKRKVENSWLRPPSASDRNLEAEVRVRLSESGAVLLVKVIKSSGNGAFDRSVVAAVYKAEPLPMPESPRLKQEFRDFTFIFKPTSQ